MTENRNEQYELVDDPQIVAFRSFVEAHPELWERIGRYWPVRFDEKSGRYFHYREAICLVGKFPVTLFEAEARRAFA